MKRLRFGSDLKERTRFRPSLGCLLPRDCHFCRSPGARAASTLEAMDLDAIAQSIDTAIRRLEKLPRRCRPGTRSIQARNAVQRAREGAGKDRGSTEEG